MMEKATTIPFTSPLEVTHGLFHTGKRLRHLLRSDGEKVHIAATPEEHIRLTHTLPNTEIDDNLSMAQWSISRQSETYTIIMRKGEPTFAPCMGMSTMSSRRSGWTLIHWRTSYTT